MSTGLPLLYPEQQAELTAYKAANPNVKLWHDGNIVRALPVLPSIVPVKISRRQAWLELDARNRLDDAKALAVTEGGELAIYFFDSAEYLRKHPQTAAAFALFGMSEAEADAFFVAAAARA